MLVTPTVEPVAPPQTKLNREMYYYDLLVRYMAGILELEGESRIGCTIQLSVEDKLVLDSVEREAIATLKG